MFLFLSIQMAGVKMSNFIIQILLSAVGINVGSNVVAVVVHHLLLILVSLAIHVLLLVLLPYSKEHWQ